VQKILLVEDDLGMAQILVSALEDEDYSVDHAENGSMANAYLKDDLYDLVLLDWSLPDITGIELLRSYRARGGSKPVLMLTAQARTENKVMGFDSGADDYLTKPYELKELTARIRALLRRPIVLTETTLKSGDLELQPKGHYLSVRGHERKLPPRDFALLEHFMRHPGELFTSEALLARIWGYSDEATADALRASIKRIRSIIDDPDTSESTIENVAKVGYRLRT